MTLPFMAGRFGPFRSRVDPDDTISINLVNISAQEGAMLKFIDYNGDELIVTRHEEGLRFSNHKRNPTLLTDNALARLSNEIDKFLSSRRSNQRDTSVHGTILP